MDGRGLDARSPRGAARLSELIALVLALEERAGLAEADRRRLDREIGARVDGRDAMALLRSWLREAPSAGLRTRLGRVEAALAMLGWLWLGIGSFLGWAAAAALLSIEIHAGRVNIVLCVVILVLVPLGMLVLAWLGWLRSLAPVDDTRPPILGGLRRLGLGRLALRLLTPAVRSDVEVVIGRLSAHRRLYAKVQRAQLLVWSQLLGLGFALGALAATLGFVVFTDLAFGWSTTLQVEAADLHPWIERFAWPWRALWPEAVPSLALVESTRHFRVAVDDNHIHFIDPILYGGWWPFLVMALTLYNFLPRILTLLGLQRWRALETGRAMARTPGAEALIDRLRTPLIDSRADAPEDATGVWSGGLAPVVEIQAWLEARGGDEATVIRWAELATDAALAELLGAAGLRIRDAGGRRSLEEDAAVRAACAEAGGPILLCVRGYEPPVLDILDFVGDLRKRIGPDRPLAIVLLGGDATHRDGWRRKLAGLGDPGIVVGLLEAEDV